MTRVAVMGGGSFGTAMGMIATDAGGEVVIWAREPEVAQSVNELHINEMYHPGLELPPELWVTNDPATALKGAEVIILAIPAQTLRENLTEWKSLIEPDAIIVTLMKGIEATTTKRMTEVIAEVAEVPASRVAAGRQSSTGDTRRQ